MKDPTYIYWTPGPGQPGHARFLVGYDKQSLSVLPRGTIAQDLATLAFYRHDGATPGGVLAADVDLIEAAVGELLAARAVSAAITITDNDDSTGTIAIQLQDGEDDPVEESRLIEVWVGATAGAPTASIGTLSVEDGITVQTITANAHLRLLTDATGYAEILLTPSAVPDDAFVTVVVDGRVFAEDETIADHTA